MSLNVKVYYYRNGERNPSTDIRRLRVPANISYEDLVAKIKESQNWIQDGAVTYKYVDEENDHVQFSSNEEWQIAVESLNEKDDKVLRVHVSGPNPVKENRGPWGGCGGWRRRQHCPFAQSSECGQPDVQQIFNAAKPFVDAFVQNLQQATAEESTSTETTNEAKQESNSNDAPPQVHYGVTCDGCDQENIAGDRFKCAECPNFDYCASCYNTPEMRESHGNHKFVKVDRAQRPRCGQRGFDFSQFMNHPLAQQFLGQQGGNQQAGQQRGFDFSQILNHPLAQQFLSQQGGQQGGQQGSQQTGQQPGFDFTQILNHPLAQQFLSQQGGQQDGQQFDLNQLINQYQPFIQQFAQNLSGQQEQQFEQKQETQQPEQAQAAPQPTEEEIVIDESKPERVFAYTAQLEQLASMGFVDTERNKDLLIRYSGNVGRVVQVLLQ